MNTAIKIETNEYGMVIGVHDGYLSQLSISEDKINFNIKKAAVGKNVTEIELLGVKLFNIKELSNGAIISEVYSHKICEILDSNWDIPDSGWNVLLDNYKQEDAKKIVADLANENPNYLLVHISCSYGGSLAVICETISKRIYNPTP